MSDTLTQRAFDAVNTSEFAAMSPKARLEAFAWEYCRTVAAAGDGDVDLEARSLGLPTERIAELRTLVSADRARILAEVLRVFGDREQGTEHASKLDRLLDEVLGTSGFEGTIPG